MPNKTMKAVLGTAAAFVAWRAYKLWEMFNGINYVFKRIRFSKPTSDVATDYRMVVTYGISNPSNTMFSLKRMYGDVYLAGSKIGFFSTKPFTIKPGEQDIDVSISLSPLFISNTMLPMLKEGNYPVFDIVTTAVLPVGIRKTFKFQVNSKDYIPSYVTSALSALSIFK